MYQEKLVTVIKHNGRVLREQDGTVHIPFGSEYTLHFKNMNTVRALVRVEVDGQDATEGTSLIVPANGTLDLERFIKNGNLTTGHRFKFIERTSKIEDGPRGIKAEDGLIRVEFEFEKQPVKVEYETIKRTYVDEYWRSRPWPIWYGPNYVVTSTPWQSGEITCSASNGSAGVSGGLRGVSSSEVKLGSANASFSATSGDVGIAQNCANINAFTSFVHDSNPVEKEVKTGGMLNEVGITVAGSESQQTFSQGAWFPTDGQKHVMVLKLLGMVGEKAVVAPVTVKTQQECPTCGTKNKHGTKFCRECGTNLTAA
mgnify:CR=1 FL=1